MKFNELLRKIRMESNLRYSEMADKIGFSKGFISNVEKGKRGVSEKYLSVLIKQFPLYEEELVKAYTEQKIPAIADNKIKIEGFGKVDISQMKEYKFKVYRFISSNDGRVELTEFEEMTSVIDKEIGDKILKEGFVFEVFDNAVAPILFENDKIVFIKENFSRWEDLDSKLILIKLNNDFYIRKLYFQGGEPYLCSFNERMYPKIKLYDIEKVEYIGKLDSQLHRDLKKITF